MEAPTRIKVWDGGTRLFHWALVILFCMSAYSAFQDKFGIYADMHLYSGVAILILLVWRILWGLIGSETSRFSSFTPSPKALLKHLKGNGPEKYGHNPMGALSVYLVILLLLAQVVLGLYSSDGMLFSGPFSHLTDDANDITNIHEYVGYTLFGWCGLHLLSVLFYAVVKKKNLIGPMFTGKTKQLNAVAPIIRSPFLSLLCLAISGTGVWWWVFGF